VRLTHTRRFIIFSLFLTSLVIERSHPRLCGAALMVAGLAGSYCGTIWSGRWDHQRHRYAAHCPTSSSCGAFPLASGPTTDRDSSPRRCRNGLQLSVPRPPTRAGQSLGERLHRVDCAFVLGLESMLLKDPPKSFFNRIDRKSTWAGSTSRSDSPGGPVSRVRLPAPSRLDATALHFPC